MSLRKFLWCFSLSVFLAGLIYRYAGPLGLFKGDAGTAPGYAVNLFSGSHEPNDHFVSPIIGRHSSFWFLTTADRAVSSELLFGKGLVFLTDLGPHLSGFDLSAEARVGPDGPGLEDPSAIPEPGIK